MATHYSWDEYFMTMAYLISMKSKDPSTRVGAVIVDEDKEIRSTGYNGLPRGVTDKPDRYADKNYKYLASNHAEENALLYCARVGTAIKNCSLYTTWIPCSRCAKSIIQVGIKEVIFDANFPGNLVSNQNEYWRESIQISKEILLEANVKIREYDKKLIEIKGLYQAKEFCVKYTT
ncbi:deoxycytidylate deaminase [Candidatus Bandiella euplotis]|uniref:dCMP deaminase family protein n=1 Tax=Candidatus Bandiella euplotis TaxID=1664265 RepID=A0ABZ0ULZ3_9RICK|nr:dCMP deaminase family protein [Candidatus Bandiella woodruffii]WPX95939.1 dCMP deaminase family protein [Candidatus Bandiella woodruffii]